MHNHMSHTEPHTAKQIATPTHRDTTALVFFVGISSKDRSWGFGCGWCCW